MESKVLVEITELIAKDKIKEAIESLQQLLNGSPLLDEVILQSARYTDLKKQIRMDTLEYEKADISKNKLRLALLEMVGELEDKAEQDEKVSAALEITKTNLHVNQLKAKDDITIKTDQQNSKADISNLDAGGKIKIDIKQK